MYRAFLIKYSEIGIKGKNRYVFENILKENIRKALDALMPGYVISKEQGRVFVECPQGYDYEDTIEALKKVFGIAGICPVVVIEDIEWENLKLKVGDYVEKGEALATIHAADKAQKETAVKRFLEAYRFSNTPIEKTSVIKQIIS